MVALVGTTCSDVGEYVGVVCVGVGVGVSC